MLRITPAAGFSSQEMLQAPPLPESIFRPATQCGSLAENAPDARDRPALLSRTRLVEDGGASNLWKILEQGPMAIRIVSLPYTACRR
jgi:hypothetical protein